MSDVINSSGIFSVAERTERLFNNSFLSDVQFRLGEQTIYAHSLQLMVCSTVFQEQLEPTLGDKKLIPISDVSYDSFYQFLRFIYTDKICTNKTNFIEILKLSKRYKVIKLHNEVLNFVHDYDTWLKFYEYCLLERDELHLRRSEDTILKNLGDALSSQQFLTIHPCVVEAILKFNHANVSEVQMFEALVRWITQNSKDNNISFSRLAVHYEKYVHLIRFPVMTPNSVVRCITNNEHLFKESDYATIIKALGQTTRNGSELWNSQARQKYIFPYIYENVDKLDTQFTVTRKMLLTGLRFGRCTDDVIGITLTRKKGLMISGKSELFKFDCKSSIQWSSIVLNLGESNELWPGTEYTVAINLYAYSECIKPSQNFLRYKTNDVYVNIPTNLIKFSRVSRSMFEMYFKLD